MPLPTQIAVIVVLTLLFMLGGCTPDRQVAASPVQYLQCEVGKAEERAFPVEYSVPGTVVADDRIQITSRVVGFIQRLNVDEGQSVSRGQVLVQIDPKDINAAIQQGKAALDAARRELEDAIQDVGKYEQLIESGAVASETLRKARVKRDIARSSVSRAISALDAAKAQQSYSRIKSPVDGVIIAKHQHVGDMATAGSPILTIESRRQILFRVFVTEGRIATIRTDMQVPVFIDALKQRTFPGRVLRIIPSGDSTTRRYQVEIKLPDDPAIMFGMFGRANFIQGEERHVAIPLSAKIERGGLEGVFVVDDTNRARFRWVRFGHSRNGFTMVTAGLSGGERLVLNAGKQVRDGVIINHAACQGADNG